MSHTGKIVGAFFGYLLLGPIGAFFGILIGHSFDRGLNSFSYTLHPGQLAQAQQVFFATTFQVMGHLAKADGRVSEKEIQLTRQVMSRLGLNQKQCRIAIDYFNQGKQPHFDFTSALSHFKRNCGSYPPLVRLFFEFQLYVAQADGGMTKQEVNLLRLISEYLGLRFVNFESNQQQYRDYGPHRHHARPQQDRLSEAYKTLGVPPSSNDNEIKRGYRRLMNQNHPDKLIAKGLPESMIKVATEKTQEIKAAYELIKRSRQTHQKQSH